MGRLFRQNDPEIFAILAFWQSIDDPLQLPLVDEVHPERDFLQTRDFHSLAVLDCRDVIARFEQADFTWSSFRLR